MASMDARRFKERLLECHEKFLAKSYDGFCERNNVQKQLQFSDDLRHLLSKLFERTQPAIQEELKLPDDKFFNFLSSIDYTKAEHIMVSWLRKYLEQSADSSQLFFTQSDGQQIDSQIILENLLDQRLFAALHRDSTLSEAVCYINDFEEQSIPEFVTTAPISAMRYRRAVIVNFAFKGTGNERHGSDKDVEYLLKTFQMLNWTTTVQECSTIDDFSSEIAKGVEFCVENYPSNHAITNQDGTAALVFIIMTHGHKDVLLIDDKLYNIGKLFVSIRKEIISVAGERSLSLMPTKVLGIIQACQDYRNKIDDYSEGEWPERFQALNPNPSETSQDSSSPQIIRLNPRVQSDAINGEIDEGNLQSLISYGYMLPSDSGEVLRTTNHGSPFVVSLCFELLYRAKSYLANSKLTTFKVLSDHIVQRYRRWSANLVLESSSESDEPIEVNLARIGDLYLYGYNKD